MYKPNPVDTKNIKISSDIDELSEELAKNIHDVWAQQRINQGWIYGPERNDRKKEHPNLVPYEQLSEIDKNYDRNTAMETLKMIMKLGYTIKKKDDVD